MAEHILETDGFTLSFSLSRFLSAQAELLWLLSFLCSPLCYGCLIRFLLFWRFHTKILHIPQHEYEINIARFCIENKFGLNYT